MDSPNHPRSDTPSHSFQRTQTLLSDFDRFTLEQMMGLMSPGLPETPPTRCSGDGGGGRGGGNGGGGRGGGNGGGGRAGGDGDGDGSGSGGSPGLPETPPTRCSGDDGGGRGGGNGGGGRGGGDGGGGRGGGDGDGDGSGGSESGWALHQRRVDCCGEGMR
ncbi:protein FAM98B-like [Salvia hispanica]|uniref:protein FAM98B-like n=1 Tax=Salvia hispanica TaxID=49212 RepID=UPI0020097E3F|nr:protein FAM98B-like [Salvia hispanica]